MPKRYPEHVQIGGVIGNGAFLNLSLFIFDFTPFHALLSSLALLAEAYALARPREQSGASRWVMRTCRRTLIWSRARSGALVTARLSCESNSEPRGRRMA